MDYPDAAYSQPLRLTYSLHSKTMMESIQSCQRRLCYTDVQLISEGGIVFAHSIVLAGASSFLKQLLISNPDPTIVIHLPGVDYEPLRLLLEVLYGGEELQLTLKQVVALQDLGSLLHIDMCNSAAMEQAFLQASQEGVLSIPGSLQQSIDTINYSNESSPAPTPQPPQQSEIPPRRTPAKSSNSPGKGSHINNNNNNNNNTTSSTNKKRKSGIQHSPSPMAPFSLLTNVTPNRAGTKRNMNEETSLMDDDEDIEKSTIPQHPPKKLSRAAQKEMVTCRECHTPFKLIMQLNQHMTREGHLFPPCPECNIIHSTLESLISHVDVHPSETVFTCKYCQKGVMGHDRYLYHMLMCKSLIRGDYVCFICRKSFRNSGSLKTHLLLHTGAKPFPCNYCSASFRQRHHRSHHERSVHLMQGLNNAEPVETTTAAAADPEVPTTPQSVVDGSRPFPCGFCNAAFRQSNHRSYHERVIHGVDRRTRQPKGGPMTRIPTNSTGGNGGGTKGSNGGARKSITRPSVGNGFNSAVEPDDEEEVEEVDDAEEVEDGEEVDPDAEDGDIVEELDGEAEVEGDADGWIDEEMASPDPEAEEDDQVEEEEGEGEEEEEEEAESEIAAEAASPASATTKVDSEAEEAD